MKLLSFGLFLFLGVAATQNAYARCEYKRTCNIQGQCSYDLVCDNNVPNPGKDCSYQNVCDSKGCRYERVCR